MKFSFGAKARNMHKNDRRAKKGVSGRDCSKTIVRGMLERDGIVRATVVPDRSKPTCASMCAITSIPVRLCLPMKPFTRVAHGR